MNTGKTAGKKVFGKKDWPDKLKSIKSSLSWQIFCDDLQILTPQNLF